MRFGSKITICITLLLALVFGLGGSVLISSAFDQAVERERTNAMSSHQLVLYALNSVSASSSVSNYEHFKSALSQLDSQNYHTWKSLRLTSGDEIIYRSDFSYFSNEPMNISDEDVWVSVILEYNGMYFMQITSQFSVNDDVFYLDGLYDIQSAFAARSEQQRVYGSLFAAVIIFGGFLSFFLARWLTRPLRKLSYMTRKVAGGDLSCRAEVATNDEIGHLSEDFNYMTAKLEENMEELKDSMRRQEEFMGNFAHELKTPMTSIIGYADLLRSQELTPRDRRESANYIFNEGRRLESLSLKFLELLVSKQRNFTFEAVSPAQIIKGVVSLLRPVVLRQNITITCKCEEGKCMLEPDLVKSLVLNLTDNARKALEGGGAILIESIMLPGGCMIRVTDNGRGIPQEDLSKIKEAFYRVDKSRDRAQGGAGLGLPLCQEIVELHNGKLYFESVLGKGTRVTAELYGGDAAE